MPTSSPLRLSLALAAGIGAACGGLGAAGLLTPLDDALYDRLATRLPPPPAPSPVVIVAIDEPSFADLGLAWPWPRALHARLVESLRRAGAVAIGVDILFADPGDAAGDAELAAAMGADVVLAADLARIATPQGELAVGVEPFAALLEAGARRGLVLLPVDGDGAVRQFSAGADSFAATLTGIAAPAAGLRLDWSRPPAAFPRVSYYQALDAGGMLPPNLLRGRIVLVGMALRADADADAADRLRTPWTARGAGLAPGVELHARAVETLLTGRWTRPAPAWLASLLALVAALAVAALARGRAAPWAFALAVAAAAALAATSWAGLTAGIWLPPASAALAAIASGAAEVGLGFARERRARRQVTRAFEHYLAPALVRRLAEDPAALRLGGETRTVTVLFCDLRGFTTLAEAMQDDPEGLTALAGRALSAVAREVLIRDGMIDKFIGDCVMAVWNAPLDCPDHAARAVAAAVAAVEAVARLSEELAAEYAAAGRTPPRLAAGVGVNTGPAVVGNVGAANRFDYTAIGDAVNLAARLESLTKAYGTPVLIGEATAAEPGLPPLVELDLVAVKGRRGAVRLFAPAPAGGLSLQADALARYRNRRWNEAVEAWRGLAAAAPALAAYADVMASRATAYRAAPPAADWAGEWQAESK